MNQLTLEWQSACQTKTHRISDQERSKNPGTVRIGRDPSRCDLVLKDPTVSGLHIELYFNRSKQAFFLRNLRLTNPPMVNGRQMTDTEVPLYPGSTIHLGHVELNVVSVSLDIAHQLLKTPA